MQTGLCYSRKVFPQHSVMPPGNALQHTHECGNGRACSFEGKAKEPGGRKTVPWDRPESAEAASFPPWLVWAAR